MADKQKNLQLIQVLRGVASLLVVLYHTTLNFNEIFGRQFLSDFFSFGNTGVDIFFVLSGFIIAYTSFASIHSPQKIVPFFRRRFIRIYPVYWIIISLFLLAQVLLPSYYKTHYDFNPGNVLSTYLLWPWHTMVNGVSWTLSYELFYYVLFSFAFLIKNKKLAAGLMITYILSVGYMYNFNYDYLNQNKLMSFLFFPMNIEFFMGVTAALLVLKQNSLPAKTLIVSGSVLFCLSVAMNYSGYQLTDRMFSRVLSFGVSSFLLVTGVAAYEFHKTVSVHRIFLSLGNASYSLYLLHLPFVVAGLRILSKFNIQNSAILTVVSLLFVTVICYGSVLFYKYVEKPLITKLNIRKNIKIAPVVSR